MARLPQGAVRNVGISYYEQDVYTHRPRFQVVHLGLYGEAKDSVEEMARKEIGSMALPGEIYRDTLHKNLFVISESAAKRSYKSAWRNYTEDNTYEPECDVPTCHKLAETTVDGMNYCAEHEPSPGY